MLSDVTIHEAKTNSLNFNLRLPFLSNKIFINSLRADPARTVVSVDSGITVSSSLSGAEDLWRSLLRTQG